MYTKYYTLNIMDASKVNAEHKRRKILRKRIKGACVIAGIVSSFYLLGIVGGLEQDMLTIKEFICHAILAVSILWASIRIGGYNK